MQAMAETKGNTKKEMKVRSQRPSSVGQEDEGDKNQNFINPIVVGEHLLACDTHFEASFCFISSVVLTSTPHCAFNFHNELTESSTISVGADLDEQSRNLLLVP